MCFIPCVTVIPLQPIAIIMQELPNHWQQLLAISPTAARLPAREAYSLLGRKATGGQKGIVVQQGKKIFRKQSR